MDEIVQTPEFDDMTFFNPVRPTCSWKRYLGWFDWDFRPEIRICGQMSTLKRPSDTRVEQTDDQNPSECIGRVSGWCIKLIKSVENAI